MDLGALMKDLDPNMLQELLAEGMNDPALQEMVSLYYSRLYTITTCFVYLCNLVPYQLFIIHSV
jgi:hypothetical protein